MDTSPATHSSTQIHTVAAGLMTVVDVDAAATQLCRIYGEDRTRAALVTIARQERRGQRTYEARSLPRGTTSQSRRAPHALAPRSFGARPSPSRRRGTRRPDWP